MSFIFIKLGGSVITEKAKPFTVRQENLHRLVREIATAKHKNPDLQLLIGHGSGSFGHFVTRKFISPPDPEGVSFGDKGDLGDYSKQAITEIHEAAESLHQIVLRQFESAQLSVQSISLESILENPAEILNESDIPLVYGDISNDGMIYSTEMIFQKIIESFTMKNVATAGFSAPKVKKIILITDSAGVLDTTGKIYPQITPENFPEIRTHLKLSEHDVTGGMLHKLEISLEWAQQGIPTIILNGNEAGNLEKALLGKEVKGTIVGT